MNAHEFQQHAEDYMDSAGLANVLSEIAEICMNKAAHAEESWQDAQLAKRWDNAADKLTMLASKIDDPLAP